MDINKEVDFQVNLSRNTFNVPLPDAIRQEAAANPSRNFEVGFSRLRLTPALEWDVGVRARYGFDVYDGNKIEETVVLKADIDPSKRLNPIYRTKLPLEDISDYGDLIKKFNYAMCNRADLFAAAPCLLDWINPTPNNVAIPTEPEKIIGKSLLSPSLIRNRHDFYVRLNRNRYYPNNPTLEHRQFYGYLAEQLYFEELNSWDFPSMAENSSATSSPTYLRILLKTGFCLAMSPSSFLGRLITNFDFPGVTKQGGRLYLGLENNISEDGNPSFTLYTSKKKVTESAFPSIGLDPDFDVLFTPQTTPFCLDSKLTLTAADLYNKTLVQTRFENCLEKLSLMFGFTLKMTHLSKSRFVVGKKFRKIRCKLEMSNRLKLILNDIVLQQEKSLIHNQLKLSKSQFVTLPPQLAIFFNGSRGECSGYLRNEGSYYTWDPPQQARHPTQSSQNPHHPHQLISYFKSGRDFDQDILQEDAIKINLYPPTVTSGMTHLGTCTPIQVSGTLIIRML